MFDSDDIPSGPVKPTAPATGGFSAEDIPDQTAPSGRLPGAPTGLDFSEFRFQPKVNVDNYLLRAQDQGFWEQAGKTVGNTVANVVTGVVEGFGYLPELLDSSNDYTNALTRKMQEWKNPFGEVYRENPNEVFDLTDPAWWLNNVQTLAESAGAFAIEGFGLAKIFGGLAKGASRLANAQRIGKAVARGAAETASAATLAYTEGAMSGYRTYETAYKENYDKAIQNGQTKDQAHETAARIASNAASTVVRLNTMMNTVLNIGALAPLFHEPTDDILQWFKTEGLRKGGESRQQWRKRLMEAAEANPELKKAITSRGRKGWSSMLAEMQKEGIEEVNTQYAEAEGQRVAEGEERDLFGALTDIGQYFEDVTNEEGALNYILGSVGGVAQTALIDHVPSKKVLRYDDNGKEILKTNAAGDIQYDKNGKPKYQKQWVSPKSRNAFGSNKYFENIRDSIVSDIDHMEKLNTQLIAAKAKGNQAEMERIRGEIFSVGALDAVRKGLGDSWIQEYEEIAGLDNSESLGAQLQPQIDELNQQIAEAREQQDAETVDALVPKMHKLVADQIKLQDTSEAMQRGFARDMKDDNYKERARQSIEDLKHLQEVHKAIQKKWVSEDNPATGELADHLFFRSADLYLRGKAIEREEARIQKLEQLNAGMTLPSAVAMDTSINKYNEHLGILEKTREGLQADMEVIQEADKAGDVKTLQAMIEKYRAKGLHDSDIAGAINDLAYKIGLKIKQYETSIKAARQQMEESTGFIEWQKDNESKKFEDYVKTVGQSSLLQEDKANLETLKTQHEIAEQNFNEMTAGQGIDRMLKAFAEQKRKMVDAVNDRNKKESIEDYMRLQTKKAAAKMSVKDKQARAQRLQDRIDQLLTQLKAANQKKTELEDQIKAAHAKKLGVFTQIDKLVQLRSELSRQKGIIKSLEAQIRLATEQLQLLNVKIQQAEAKQAEVEKTTIDDLNKTEDTPSQEVLRAEDAAIDEHQEANLNLTDLMASEEESKSADPVGDYMNLRKTWPPVLLPVLDELEKKYQGKETSYQGFDNAFRQAMHLELVDQGQVTAAYFKFRDYLAEMAKPQPDLAPASTVTDLVSEPAAEDVATEEVPLDFEIGGQPVISIDEAIFTEQGLHDMAWEDSAKTVDAVKANSSDLQYIPVVYNGTVMLRNKTVNGAPQLDETANKDRMLPGVIAIGDDVELQIDTNWDGKINNDHQLEQDENLQEERVDDRYENYIDENGKIRMQEHEATVGYGNVPIKIMHKKTGKVIGYFPRVDWITATQGAQGFRNVSDDFPPDEQGRKAKGNNAYQANINLRIRRHLAQMHNDRPGATLTTKVADRTPGRVLYHGDLNESTGRVNYKTKLAKSLLPDKSLQYGVMTKDGPKIDKSTFANKVMTLVPINEKQKERIIGAPIVFLPLPDGRYKIVPLMSTRFEDREADLRTVTRVIELYLQHDTSHLEPKGQKIIDKIKDKTGFDITDEEGLRNFITQYYTFTSNFKDSQTEATAPANTKTGKRVPKFMLAIPRKGSASKAPIKVGVSYSGQNVVYAKLKNGKLDPVFAESLRNGLIKRFKNVTLVDRQTEEDEEGNKKEKIVINGVNENKPITTITINKNDVASAKSYDTYNDYLRDNLYTAVHGLTQVNGQYVYAANSQVVLDKEVLDSSLPSRITQNARELTVSTDSSTAGEVTPVEQDVMDVWEDNLGLEQRISEYVKHVIRPEGTPVNLANLTEMHRFTEDSSRNAKSPQEVLDYLTGLGISSIADGYNPFLKCS